MQKCRALFYYHFAQRRAVNGAVAPSSWGGKERTVNMALFKRPALKEQGLSDAQIEWLMTEAQRSLSANYIPKSDVKEQIDTAVQNALKDAPQAINPTDTDEYKSVAEERDMLRALSGDDFASVKPKFREAVYKMLERGENAPPVAEQLKTVAEKYEEYFTPTDTPQAPQFGAEVRGQMPSGKTEKTFMDVWGYDRKG